MKYIISYDKTTKEIISIFRGSVYEKIDKINVDTVEVDSVLGEAIKESPEEFMYSPELNTFTKGTAQQVIL
jgi:hypothetical protein